MYSVAFGVAALVTGLGEAVVLRGRMEEQVDLYKGRMRMNPGAAALTFRRVEDGWRGQAALFVECNVTGVSDCSSGPMSFASSCAKLSGAVVQASSGDRAAVAEYLADVCGEPTLDSGYVETCKGFASMLTSAMGPDSFENRENLVLQGPCMTLWQQFEVQERARIEQERAKAAAEAEEAVRIEAEKETDAEAQRVAAAKEEVEKQQREEAEKLQREEAEKQQREEAERQRQEAEEAAKAAEQAYPAQAVVPVAMANAIATDVSGMDVIESKSNNTDLTGMVSVDGLAPNRSAEASSTGDNPMADAKSNNTDLTGMVSVDGLAPNRSAEASSTGDNPVADTGNNTSAAVTGEIPVAAAEVAHKSDEVSANVTH